MFAPSLPGKHILVEASPWTCRARCAGNSGWCCSAEGFPWQEHISLQRLFMFAAAWCYGSKKSPRAAHGVELPDAHAARKHELVLEGAPTVWPSAAAL